MARPWVQANHRSFERNVRGNHAAETNLPGRETRFPRFPWMVEVGVMFGKSYRIAQALLSGHLPKM